MNRNQYELYHYGIKGMKWGHRKKQLPTSSIRKRVDSTKAEFKRAKKAHYDADKLKSLKAAHKNAKRERNMAIKNTQREIRKNGSFADKFFYNDSTRKKAAKYVVDNNMSVDEAVKKAKHIYNRNTAIYLAAYTPIAIGSIWATTH